jgi:transmembrane sensor
MSRERNQQIEEAASEWIAHRYSGAWTEDDQRAFDQWIGASLENRLAYLRLDLAWRQSDRLKALGAGHPGLVPPPRGQWNLGPFFDEPRVTDGVTRTDPAEPATSGTRDRRRATRRVSRVYALAAGILLATLIVASTYSLWPTGRAYRTEIGSTASVPMTDGSKVTLNTNSQIRIDLSDRERHIELNSGEAFFEVAHDPGRPFVVHAGNKRVVAVGTKFSVRREGSNVQVVVTEGKVRLEGDAIIEARHDGTAEVDPRNNGASGRGPLYLVAGEVAHASNEGVLVQTKAIPEVEEELSWRSGVLIFRNQSLAAAIAEFNRYNTRHIVIADERIADLRIEGNFRATNIDAFVRLLEQGYSLRVLEEGDRIVLAQ